MPYSPNPRPGHLTLTHWDAGTAEATIEVSVEIHGQPLAISFAPRYLADALAIGPVLRLIDGISPGLTSDLSGNRTYCVIMPRRFAEIAEDAPESGMEQAAQAPDPAMAA